MNRFYVIGIGPGALGYLVPVARKAIESSDCLIAAKRNLLLFRHPDKERVCFEGNFNRIISYIKENRDKKRIAVLVSGDPGLYSFLGQIQRAFEKHDYAVIPGISVLQVAFAKIGENWQDAKILSIHGRSLCSLPEEVKDSDKVFLFTDAGFPPDRIASLLLKKGITNRDAVVFQNLSLPNEKIFDTNLKDLSKMKGFKLCVMIIKK